MTETKHTRDEGLLIGAAVVALVFILFCPPVALAVRALIWLKAGVFF